jgi:hypothetical protein
MLQTSYAVLEAAKLGYLHFDDRLSERRKRAIVPPMIEIPVTLLTKENVAAYIPGE